MCVYLLGGINVQSIINEEKLISKMRWRIIPWCMLLYVISMIDRLNISYAALQMNEELGISPSLFGLIAGIFFVAYLFFEVPSNVLMYKFGAKKWLTRIIISWGAVTAITGFANTPGQLFICRILLAIAEAGLYPCIIFYLTLWFPQRYMAKTTALFMTGLAVSNIFGGPIATLIMDNISWFSLSGWRWLFFLEGIPTIILGIITAFIIVDQPEKAKFLNSAEKKWLINELDKDIKAKVENNSKTSYKSKWSVFKDIRAYHAAAAYFCWVMALYGLGLWLPQIIKNLSDSLSTFQVGLLAAIPFIFGLIAMLILGNHSDKTGERRLHVGLPMILPAVGLVALTFSSGNVWLSIACICLAQMGIQPFIGSYWTLSTSFLSGEAAAVGLALINCLGNLGGFVGPYIVGFIMESTGSSNGGMYFLAVVALIGGLLAVLMPNPKPKEVKVTNEEIVY